VVIAIVGPTAIGKSALGLAVAEALGGEIVNADAMQLYRGMEIGTAKPAAADRARIPHHLFDEYDISEAVSVADYQQRVRAVFDEIAARGARPVLVGGSWLYVRAALDDLRFPGTDAEVRTALEERAARDGSEALHAELARLDPAAAAAILPTNTRRIVRALEVLHLGQPFTATLGDVGEHVPSVRIGLTAPREELDVRIALRVELMFRGGFVDEVRGLTGLEDAPTAAKALGYAQVLRMLRGEIDQQAAIDETIAATRTFARRQERYLRRDQRVRWFPYDDEDLVDRVVDAIVAGTST
jgi:tRNA dimethylallyltransferase